MRAALSPGRYDIRLSDAIEGVNEKAQPGPRAQRDRFRHLTSRTVAPFGIGDTAWLCDVRSQVFGRREVSDGVWFAI